MIINDLKKGDIIRVVQDVFIEYPGGAWKDHFIKKPVLYVVNDAPTNNGNFTARRPGCSKHFNAVYNDIIQVICK